MDADQRRQRPPTGLEALTASFRRPWRAIVTKSCPALRAAVAPPPPAAQVHKCRWMRTTRLGDFSPDSEDVAPDLAGRYPLQRRGAENLSSKSETEMTDEFEEGRATAERRRPPARRWEGPQMRNRTPTDVVHDFLKHVADPSPDALREPVL